MIVSRRSFAKIALAAVSARLAIPSRAALATPLDVKQFIDSLPMQDGPFAPSWESLSHQYRVPEWFRDAKLGIFLHWGPCSVPAYDGWYGKQLYRQHPTDWAKDRGVYEWHIAHYGHPSTFGYKDIIPLWKAENWNADSLVRQFKLAGARYIMPVAVHHDGFDNWNSKYQPWNSVNMGPRRDIVAEWRAAALKQDIVFCVSTHHAQTWDWLGFQAHNADSTGPLKGVPYDGFLSQAEGKGKWWEGYDPQDFYVQQYPPSLPDLDVMHHLIAPKTETEPRAWDVTSATGKVLGTLTPDPAAQAKFIRRWYLRSMDLIDTFHPNQFYIDFSVPFTDTPYGDAVWRRLQAHYYNASLKWNGGRMIVGTNIKNIGDNEMIRRSCIEDFEGGKEGDIPLPLPWQHDDSVNQEWFYDGNSPRRSTKSPAQVVRMLVDTVSRNGNLLLNVGLRADGTVPPEEQDVLEGLAEFMGANGEAIHGSRPWKISTDRASDVFFTTKGEALYALVLRWPEGGKLELPALAAGKSPWLAGVQKVSLLGSDSRIKWMRTAAGMSFELPREKQANFLGLGLKLEGQGSPV